MGAGMPTHYNGTECEKRALDLFIKLNRAAESVNGRTMASIMGAGLTPTQFGVLETLYHLGPLMPSQLAEKHLKSRNNFTLVIDNLEKAGLVSRMRSDTDRRAVFVSLTELGTYKVKAVLPQFVNALVTDVGILDKCEQEQLGELLRKLGKGK